MEISLRLKCIASHIEPCNCIADIGTDHGYIPIYLLKQNKCEKAIATDINIGPVEKAKFNIDMVGLENKVECRLGGGLSTIKTKEADVIIIAGMGGNLIRDIIENDIEIFRSASYAVLQPVQNPGILRKYLLEKGFHIIDEDLCLDDNKYYEIIKVSFDNKPIIKEEIFYEVSEILIKKTHPLIKEYIQTKIAKYTKINESILDDTQAAIFRKNEMYSKVQRLKELLLCL